MAHLRMRLTKAKEATISLEASPLLSSTIYIDTNTTGGGLISRIKGSLEKAQRTWGKGMR